MKGYYHKYFEDYEEDKVLNKNGKGTHIEYKYVGYYFRQGIRNTARIGLRILYAAMGLAAFFCLMFSATKAAHCNQAPYMIVVQALTLLVFIWFGWVLAYYVFAPREMTVYKYKSTALQMVKASKWLAAAFAVDAAAVVSDMMISGSIRDAGQISCLMGYFLGGALILGLNVIERALPYERLSNDKEIIWYRDRMEWRY